MAAVWKMRTFLEGGVLCLKNKIFMSWRLLHCIEIAGSIEEKKDRFLAFIVETAGSVD